MMTKQSVHEQGVIIVSVQVCNHRASKDTKQNLPSVERLQTIPQRLGIVRSFRSDESIRAKD